MWFSGFIHKFKKCLKASHTYSNLIIQIYLRVLKNETLEKSTCIFQDTLFASNQHICCFPYVFCLIQIIKPIIVTCNWFVSIQYLYYVSYASRNTVKCSHSKNKQHIEAPNIKVYWQLCSEENSNGLFNQS